MARVFVSSTFKDLEECRKKVSIVLRQMGHEDVAMEYFVAEDKSHLISVSKQLLLQIFM
ncbi:MAG: DUF4062 domain-containing protein [Methanosarcina sp.]|nr:MAG: DUF4062 domain-containing protein [Methanosarcina sp.]